MCELRLERRRDGQLWAVQDELSVAVQLRRCFPWSEPGRFLSLRDADEEEVALVRSAAELDPASRKVLEDALVEVGFVLEIERVLAIEEEIEIRSWRVETRQGVRSFQTPRDEWPRQVPGAGLLIRDVAGDLFYIPEPDRLDSKSRKVLWPYVD